MLEEMPARITLAYAECVKQKKKVDEGGHSACLQGNRKDSACA